MLKRKKKHEDHVDESWLIPYADVLTLLLALFIVLFAASEIDSNKYQAITRSLNSALQGGTGILEYESNVEIEGSNISSTVPFPEDLINLLPDDEGDEDEEIDSESEMSAEQDYLELLEIQKSIESYITYNGLSSRLHTAITAEGLLLTITEDVLFESGSASLSHEAQSIAREIANLLVTDPPRMIRIEGHTDSRPINTPQFPSNWELSSARAINFMKIILENDDLEPSRISATGFGEHRPISTNDNEAGRAKNRRVEVVISPYEN